MWLMSGAAARTGRYKVKIDKRYQYSKNIERCINIQPDRNSRESVLLGCKDKRAFV